MHGNEQTNRISPVSDTGDDRNGPQNGSYDATGEDFLHDSSIDEQLERAAVTIGAVSAYVFGDNEPEPGIDTDDLPYGLGACHRCGSEDITGASVVIGGDTAAQDMTCDACGASWTDVYTAWRRHDHGDELEVDSSPSREQPATIATCGNCGRSWDDGKSTGMTPTPAGRCPFEYFHDGEAVPEDWPVQPIEVRT